MNKLEEAQCYRCGRPVKYDFDEALADYKARFEDASDRPVVICDTCDREIQEADQLDSAS